MAHLLSATSTAIADSEPNSHDPVLESRQTVRNGEHLFLGTLYEDEREVKLQPNITATDEDEGKAGLICGYKIIGPHSREVPFEVKLLNNKTGAAKMVVKDGLSLNFEKRQKYKFCIVAFDCGDVRHYSNKSFVIIHVEDVDEFAPKFSQDTYEVEVEEGHLFDAIIQLTATDKDRSANFKDISGYFILDDDVPFEINKNGVLKNTEILDHSKRHNYMISVVAESYGKKKSKPALINILVKKMCKIGWKGIPKNLDYVPNSGRHKICEHAHLDLCDKPYNIEKVSVRMVLTTKHIGKGCDRDTYSISSQRKLCGASGDSIDLLPSPNVASWTSSLPTDDGNESDQIFAFDGQTNAVEVPEGHFNHTLTNHFTISTWMKHEHHQKKDHSQAPTKAHKAPKEHILCMSDGDHLNRHHYGLFVHGDKLIFLLRREAENSENMEAFRPAEWRWHLSQINDGKWHHYAISIDYPEVRLYIDGKVIVPSSHDLEVVDDWPLHQSKKVLFTELVIGACWQGNTKKFDHFFRGYLAGLSILRDKTESDRVIKCLVNCKEYLDFHALNKMESGTSVSFNSEMTEFSITGKNVTEVESLVQEVSYVNARHYPTPGRRALKIETAVEYEGPDGSNSRLPGIDSIDVDVMVMQPSRPVITIGGLSNMTLTPAELRIGYLIFKDIEISIKQEDDEDDDEDDIEDDNDDDDDDDSDNGESANKVIHQQTRKELMIDSCTIQSDPPLNLREEVLLTPHDLISQLQLESSLTNEELHIKNVDKVRDYITVMRRVRYSHKDGRKLGSRSFVVVCSSQNGRFQSKPQKIKIMAIHAEEPEANRHAHAQQLPNKQYQDNGPRLLENLRPNKQKMHSVIGGPNLGMAAIIVICVGFLLFMIILGVIRIRAAHKRTQVVAVDEKQEMEWDNSALNITVNPMDQPYGGSDSAMQALRIADSDTDDDDDSCHDSSDEEVMEKGTVTAKTSRELEWDDSTLAF